MNQRSRVDILDDSYCQFASSDPQNYLFSSPDEICHWSDSVVGSLSPPESEDFSEVMSQPESSQEYSDSSSPRNMDPITFQFTSGTSQWPPAGVSEESPDNELYHTNAWMDQVSGHAPFSPVLSDYTVPTSETSMFSLGPSAAQELPMVDPFATSTWSAQVTDRSYIDESAVPEPGFFSFPEISQPEVMPVGYPSWFTPSEVNFDSYFPMDQTQGMTAFAQVSPQTAGFVGSAPLVPTSQVGSYQTIGPQIDSVTALRYAFFEQIGLPSGQSPQADRTPELSQSKPPRRLSVALQQPTDWSPREVEQKPFHASAGRLGSPYIQNLGSIPMSRQHRSSNASVVESTCSRMSAAASSVAQVKMEQSSTAASPVSTRARSEDSEGKPRSHKFYTTARPQADGYYHCPYVHTETCTHKPTKLKCNYDKYIDSHLKPFVCKQEECKGQDNENRFSSTACLLRHEREAHGLHGHGTKPYTCHYEGCERSIPGNGFPRNYTLMDHMKRVHRHRPEERAPSTPGSTSGKRGPKSETHKIKKSRKAPEALKRTNTGSSTSSRRQVLSPIPGQEYNQQVSEYGVCSEKVQMHMMRNQPFGRDISSRYR